MNRPRNKTIKEVVDYLEGMGLSVYGQHCDLTTGELFWSNRDFDSGEVVEYKKLYEKGGLWHEYDKG